MDPMELNNQEAQYEQAIPEAPEVDGQQEAAAEPEDLAAYFRSLRTTDDAGAQTPVADQQPGGEQQQQSPVQPEQSGELGADAIDLSGFDPNARAREVYNNIRNLVVQQKKKEWDEKGYRRFSIQDLARKDQQTGRIFYVNPDDRPEDWERPGYQGLKIQEAKAWVDIQNDALNEQWKKECSELEQNIVQQSLPYFNLIAYVNVYDSLSPTEKMLVDRMTEPYALRNRNGEVVGFSCDLNTTTQIARQMAKELGANTTAQQTSTNNVRQPVVDSRSSAGGSRTSAPKEANNIQDAMRMVFAEERARRSNNG